MSSRREEWRRDAACKGTDLNWFPDFTNAKSAYRDGIVAACKAVCATCPVIGDCLDMAMREDLGDGIFGGLTRSERIQLGRANT